MKKRVVVLASGSGSTFEAIVKNCQDVEIVALICDVPGAYVLKRAEKLGIPARVVPRTPGEKREEHDLRVGDAVKAFRPDLVVLAGYMRILTSVFITRFPDGITNIHPSFLPKFRGLNTYQRALDAGETVHGTTVHWVIEDLDAGPIIAQRSVPILEDDTAETLQERTQAVERELYPYIIDQIAQGVIGQRV